MNWTEIGKNTQTPHFTLGRLLEEGPGIALFEAERSEEARQQKMMDFSFEDDHLLVQLSLPHATPVETQAQAVSLLRGETHADQIPTGHGTLSSTIYTHAGQRLDKILADEKWTPQQFQANLKSILIALGQLHAGRVGAGNISAPRFIRRMDQTWEVLGSATAATAVLRCPFLCREDMDQLGTLLVTLAHTYGQDAPPEAAPFFEQLNLVGMDCGSDRHGAPRTAADAAVLLSGESVPPAPVYHARTQGTTGLSLRRKDERQPGGLLLADLTAAQLDSLHGVCIPQHDLRLLGRLLSANQAGEIPLLYAMGEGHLLPYAVKGAWARLGKALHFSPVADVSGVKRDRRSNNRWAVRWDWPVGIKNVEIIITKLNARGELRRRTFKYQFHRYTELGCCLLTEEECGEHGCIQVLAAEPLGKGSWKLSSGLPEDCRITY